MNFNELITAAQNGDDIAFENIFNMYRPLLLKESVIDGFFDEDLFQEQCEVLTKCVKRFK